MGTFKNDLKTKVVYASDHLVDVIQEIRYSLTGGTNAKQELLDKINKVEEIKSGFQKEIQVYNNRISSEGENIEELAQGLQKVESSQNSLVREMKECESRLSQVQDEKHDKDAQIKQMKDEIL